MTPGLPSNADIAVVAARPGDAALIGGWLYETGDALFRYLFGGEAEAKRLLGHLWGQDEGGFSHRLAVMAMHGDRPLGLELGYAGRDKAALMAPLAGLLQAVLTPEALGAQAERGRLLGPIMAPIPEDAYYVQHLVAAPDARGRGIGALLLNRAFERAEEAGYAAVHLDVLSDNPARHFYLAQGMRDILESHVPPLVRECGLPGCIRMVRTF